MTASNMAAPPKKRRRLSQSPSVDGDIASSDVSEIESVDSWDGLSQSSLASASEGSINGNINGNHKPARTENDSKAQENRQAPSSSRHRNSSSGTLAKVDVPARSTNKNLFGYEVDNLLRSVQRKSPANKAADEMLLKLKTFIENLPDREPSTIDKAEKSLLKSKVVIPFPSPRPARDAKYKFGFQKPTHINVVGSYPLKTVDSLEDSAMIDFLVQMPSELFTEKDYLNYRYFHKRAFYLACLAQHIQSAESFAVDLSYSFLNGNHLLPVLVLQPRELVNGSSSAGAQWKIQILPAISQDLFPKQKTMPDKNCVRPSDSSQDSQAALTPTPFYNCSLRVDCSMTWYLKLLHDSATTSSEFRQACHLGRIWLSQRGFSSGVGDGAFGHFEWAVLVAILLQAGGPQGRRVLSPTYDAQQLFRATIQFLAMRNLQKQPLGFKTDVNISQQHLPGPLILDERTGSNLLYKMTPWSYAHLIQEAQNTIKILSSNRISKFEPVFIFKVSEKLLQYDLVVAVSDLKLPSSFLSFLDTVQGFYDTLSRGLGDRVTSLNLIFASHEQWPIHSARTDSPPSTTLLIGIVVDSSAAAKTVDRGPAAEDSNAAASFRDFWGEKAELRRFKDGQILQSVVWSGSGPIDITKEIVTFITTHRFGEKSKPAIQFYNNDSRTINAVTEGQRVGSDSSKAYLDLEQQIRSLQDLPLQVRQIQRSNPTADNKSPQDVVLQFEESGRWPDDLEAIQMTKIAFLLKLQELLENKVEIESIKIGLENDKSKILNRSFLDIIYTAGASFRIRIHHDRELTLIEKKLFDKASTSFQKEEAAVALSSFKRTFVRKPLHAQAMSKILTRFPALNETLRLVRAWFGAHLLTNHFRPEFIDLITAAAFLHPLPWSTPSSAEPGLLRTLLFISKWDWHSDPLVVDFSSGMASADLESIRTRFDAWRKVDPLMNRVAFFAATDFDHEGEIWTENAPSKLVAGRLVSLAQAACKTIKEKGIALDLRLLFKKNLKDYDFVLRLSEAAMGRRKSSKLNDQYKNLELQRLDEAQENEFDAVNLFLTELQDLYGDSVVFFHGKGADVIAGLWSPHTARRSWKVSLAYSTVPLSGVDGDNSAGVDVVINKKAMLSEMVRLGDDLVSNVEFYR